MPNDYYAVLGVGSGAMQVEIKKAYYKLSRETHPDKKSGTQEEFQKIGEAKRILLNTALKPLYDRYLHQFGHDDFVRDYKTGISTVKRRLKIQLTCYDELNIEDPNHTDAEFIRAAKIRLLNACYGDIQKIKETKDAALRALLDKNAPLEIEDFEGLDNINPSIIVDLLKSHNNGIVTNLLKNKKCGIDDIMKVMAYDKGHFDYYSILHWAAANNRSNIFNILKPYIKSEHINQGNGPGFTPLHYAAMGGYTEVVKSLLEIKGIDVNALDKLCSKKYSPLGYAKNAKIVLMLVKKGADITSKQGKQDLACVMMNFAEKGDAKSLEALLSHKLLKDKIDINARTSPGDYNNVTMIEVAAWQSDIEMLKILSKHGADANLRSINKGDNRGAILHFIVQKYSRLLSKLAYERQVLETYGTENRNVLNIHEDLSTVATKQLSAEVEFQKKSSDSADHVKRAKTKYVMVLLTLLFNADLTLRDKKNKTPLDYLSDQSLKRGLSDIACVNKYITPQVIEKYVYNRFFQGDIAFFEKSASSEQRVRFGEYFSKEVFKSFSNIDKQNFFLSIISNQITDYGQFISSFTLFLFEQDINKSIADHAKDLCDSNNFDALINEYVSESKDAHFAADTWM